MSTFTDPLLVEDLGDGNAKLLHHFGYHIGALGSPDFIVVPAGLVTDWASAPWGVRNLFPKYGNTNHPAVIHDYLYRGGYLLHVYLWRSEATGEVTVHWTKELPTRAQADAIFKEACQVKGVPGWKLELGYAGLRIGGGLAWARGHREESLMTTRCLEANDPSWPGILATEITL